MALYQDMMNTESNSLEYFIKEEPGVFHFYSSLSSDEKEQFLQQLLSINRKKLETQQQLLRDQKTELIAPIEPFNEFAFSGNLEDRTNGLQLIKEGKVGCLLLAGGQGTRLQYNGPKGMYPISVIKNKTLFRICAEKVKAASKNAGRNLSLAVMTSSENDHETRKYFKDQSYFGLRPEQVSFFMQEDLPFLDKEGHLFLSSSTTIATGPSGNGESLIHFAKSGILQKWMKEGIEYIHIIPVDNPLADPFHPELIGFHHRHNLEITVTCVQKKDPEEKVGILVLQNGRCQVIEYSEMTSEQKKMLRADGTLTHQCANLSLFCISASFIKKMANEEKTLPLHKAWKATSITDESGNTIISHQPNAWKFETFIFDWLFFATKVKALCFPREECFSPLKNASGVDSPDTVKHALQERDRKTIEKITLLPAPQFPFELSQEFYYPTTELLEKWKGKKVDSDYVEVE